MFDPSTLELARSLGTRAIQAVQSVAAAESCTGGLVSALCTSIEGSSAWFECGLVTYSPESKQRLLGVKPASLAQAGAVSDLVAEEMALGALRTSGATVSVSVTGIAGPQGGDKEVPVGLVWFGWARRAGSAVELVQTSRHLLDGNRDSVRLQAAVIALEGLLTAIT